MTAIPMGLGRGGQTIPQGQHHEDLGILLIQLVALVPLTWASIGLGAGVLVVCALGGWRVSRKVLNLLF